MLKAFYLLYDWIMLWAFGTLKDQLLGNFIFCVQVLGNCCGQGFFFGIWGFKGVGGMILSTGCVKRAIFVNVFEITKRPAYS